jgi:hypothetical protein
MEKTKKVATLYVYDYTSSSNMGSGGFHNNKELKAFVATDDDFMTSLFEEFEGGDGAWGDFDEFDSRDDDGGFEKWELKATLGLTPDRLKSLGMDLEDFEKNVKTQLEDLSIEDFEIEYFEESQYNNLFFDAKSLIEPFRDLSNDQLNSLIEALVDLRK